MAVPYTFAGQTGPIPLAELDSNFATSITLGSTALTLGSTASTLTGVSITGNAGTATNLFGGVANNIPYQTAGSTTNFIAAPSVINTFLSWNGTNFVWTTPSATGVTSFNTRTGAVTLTNTDVTTALGYTPYNPGVNTVLTSANFSTYAPTLTGTGASGTWNINVTGNAVNVTGTVAAANGGTGLTSPGTSGNVLTSNGTGWVSSPAAAAGVTSVTGTAPIASSGGTTPAISISQSNTTTDGYLSSTDWNTFNSKGSGTVTSVAGTGTVNGITLTGTVTSSGSLTLGGTLSGVDLTTQVTNTLPAGNGGTGITSPGASGNVLTSNGTAWISSPPASGATAQVIVLGTAVVGTASTTAGQPIYGKSVTVASSTWYHFEGYFSVSKSAGATTHVIDVLFGGTATINSIDWSSINNWSATSSNYTGYTGGAGSSVGTSAAATAVTGNLTAATTFATVYYMSGYVSVNAGGTFTPQYATSVAVAGAYTTAVGSWFSITAVAPVTGSGLITGSWA